MIIMVSNYCIIDELLLSFILSYSFDPFEGPVNLRVN
jgi:hypothetical protein